MFIDDDEETMRRVQLLLFSSIPMLPIQLYFTHLSASFKNTKTSSTMPQSHSPNKKLSGCFSWQ